MGGWLDGVVVGFGRGGCGLVTDGPHMEEELAHATLASFLAQLGLPALGAGYCSGESLLEAGGSRLAGCCFAGCCLGLGLGFSGALHWS